MSNNFLTVYKKGEAEVVEKKSRFIATVIPIESEEQAVAFIEEMKKKYWDARHNVFAYVIGLNNEIQRYSDDGEPSGTAGVPILEVLKKENIRNTVVVVTRYFGGTLLGTGGLVRAYSKAAKEGIENALVIEKVFFQRTYVYVDYTTSGKIQYLANQKNYIIVNTIYTDEVKFEIMIEVGEENKFEKEVQEVANGKAKVEFVNKQYGAIINKELVL